MIGELPLKPRRFALFAGGVLVLLGVILVVLWLLRVPLARSYVEGWCQKNDLTCQLEVKALGLGVLSLEDLSIGAAGKVPVEAAQIDLKLDWPEFLRPRVTAADIDRPVLRGAFQDGALSLYGLEEVILGALESDADDAASEPAVIPELIIEGGLIELQTEAGLVTGQFSSSGRPFQNGEFQVEIDPADLARGERRVSWSSGALGLEFSDGRTVGGLDLAIEDAVLDGLMLEGVALNADIAETETGLGLEVFGRANRAELGDNGAGDISFSAKASGGAVEAVSVEQVLASLETLIVTAELENVTVRDGGASGAELSLTLAPNEGGLAGPLMVEFSEAAYLESGAGTAIAQGEVHLSFGEVPAYRYVGRLSALGAKLGPEQLNGPLGAMSLPEPLTAHGAALRRALRTAAAEFNATSAWDIGYGEAGLEVQATGPLAVEAKSGLVFDVAGIGDASWLDVDQSGSRFAGDIKLGGAPGGPDFAVRVVEFSNGEGGLRLTGSNLKLAPWRAAGRTIALDLPKFNIAPNTPEGASFAGSATMSGAYPGLDLQATKLSGGLRAIKKETGWQIAALDGQCARLTSGGGAAGTLTLGRLDLPLCPVGGYFVTQRGDVSTGRIQLGDVALPFTAGGNSGELQLSNAGAEWRVGDGFGLLMTGDGFGLPMQIAERSLSIDSQTPKLTVSLADGPLQIEARLGQTDFGGDLIPANVTARDFVFTGQSAEAGLTGLMRSEYVRISDPKEDALYRPLIADLSATLRDGIFALQGPIRSEAKGLEIADTELSLDLATLNGTAAARMRPLQFAVGGLQPFDLSDLLRGVLVSAQGGIDGGADFVITDGALSGTGFVALDNLNFDTLRVGTVEGVNGRLNFTDILALTTAPNQRVTIDLMNPGVPLTEGVFDFQIVEATTAKLERGAWPFAGGELVIQPLSWTLGNTEPLSVLLEANELELEQLVDVFKVPDLQATGTVSGAFPVDVDGANLMVRGATLEADAKGGYISYEGDAGDAAKGQNEYAEYAFDALQDLYYSVMEIGAEGNLIGDIVLTAKMLGKSPDVLGGAEFDFNLRVDSNLFQLLQSTSSTASKTYIQEALELERQEKEAAAAQNQP